MQIQPAALGLSGRNLQPLLPPDALDAFVIHPPSFSMQHGSDASVTIAAVLPCQPHNILPQRSFVCSGLFRISLAATRMPQNLACAALGYAVALHGAYHSLATALGA